MVLSAEKATDNVIECMKAVGINVQDEVQTRKFLGAIAEGFFSHIKKDGDINTTGTATAQTGKMT